jgi:predicted nuclease of predicted toxin-antitoxin system
MIWLDAHLSPRVARWIREELGQEAQHVREITLREAEDEEIFKRAKQEGVVVMTKDKDFADLVARLGPPPAVIWLRCGNTSEERLKQILAAHLNEALEFAAIGEALVEIR